MGNERQGHEVGNWDDEDQNVENLTSWFVFSADHHCGQPSGMDAVRAV